MSGELIQINQNCRNCSSPLNIEEMHYYNQGDGTASCEKCEQEWMKEIEEWREGEREQMPQRP